MSKKRFAGAIGGVAIALLVLSGCAGAAQSEVADLTAEPDFTGSLTMITKFGTDPYPNYFTSIADEYMKLHPEVTINLIQETDQSIKDKIKTLAASKSLPDIYFSWTGDWAQNFIDAGLVADLTPVIAPDTEWGSSFVPAALDAFKVDGKYWGMPFLLDAKFMGYNKAAFAAAGITVPQTFEQLVDSCEPLRAAGYIPIAFGNKDGWPALHYIQQLFAYNVPAEVRERDLVPETATWDDPGYLASLNQFSELITECSENGAETNGVLYTTAQQSLANGHAAMYYQEITEFRRVIANDSQINVDGFGIFVLPSPDDAKGDPAALEGAPAGFLVNPRGNAALAVDFLTFATSLENAQALSAAPFEQPSAVLGAVNLDTSSPSVVEGAQLIADAGSLVGWLDTLTVPDVGEEWLAGIQGMITGNVSAEDLLKQVREVSDSLK